MDEVIREMICLKKSDLLFDFQPLHPQLAALLIDALNIMICDYDKTQMIFTSLYRPEDKSRSGIHATIPLRAVDVRSHYFTKIEREQFVEQINKKWSYNIKNSHKCLIFHDVNRGEHFHFQVSDETTARF